MVAQLMNDGVLPGNPEDWAKVSKVIVEDDSENNLIDLSTRILASFVFNPDTTELLETSMIHKLCLITSDLDVLAVLILKTAKMYASCMQSRWYLNGLYQAGIHLEVEMKYVPADYFFDDKAHKFILDINGKLKSAYKAQVHKQITELITEHSDEPEDTDLIPVKKIKRVIDAENIPDDITNEEANTLLDAWNKVNN